MNHKITQCRKISAKEAQTNKDWVEEGDPQGIVQEILISPYRPMVYAKPRIIPGK